MRRPLGKALAEALADQPGHYGSNHYSDAAVWELGALAAAAHMHTHSGPGDRWLAKTLCSNRSSVLPSKARQTLDNSR